MSASTDLHRPVPLLAALTAAVSLAGLGLVPRLASPGLALGLLALAVAAHRRGAFAGWGALLMAGLALLTRGLPPGGWGWPAPALLVLLVALAPGLRGERGPAAWLRWGRLGVEAIGWAIAIAAASGAALFAWFAIARPDLADLTASTKGVPLPLFLAGGAAWALLNAFGEESIFRGALTDGLVAAIGPGGALVVQAVSFGAAHWHGVPRGPAGVLLATVYGLMLGLLRNRSGGLLAPWLAHVAADLVVLLLLVTAC